MKALKKKIEDNIKQNNPKKTLEGIVVSVKRSKTATVMITRKFPHPLYKKLLKRDSKLSVGVGNCNPAVGSRVRIIETRPISKTKNFRILEEVQNGSA